MIFQAQCLFFFGFTGIMAFLVLLFLTSPATRRLPRWNRIDYRQLADCREEKR